MFGLVVMEGMTLSGHLSNINEMMQWDFVEMFGQNFSHFFEKYKKCQVIQTSHSYERRLYSRVGFV